MAHQRLKLSANCQSPQRICFADTTSSFNIFKEHNYKVEKLCLPVVPFEANNNVKVKKSHTLYILNEFENNPNMEVLEKLPNTWIFGPPALMDLSKNRTPSFRLKHLYCTSMYGLCFYIHCPRNVPLMKRMVKLIKWMGGMFHVEPAGRTTHMITNSTLADGYTYCSTFDVPILTPDWVEECWKKRNQLGFKAVSIADNYVLKPFAGLGISFAGFNPVVADNLEKTAVANGAESIQLEDPACTHMVVYDELKEHIGIEDIPLHVQYVVGSEWFKSSLQQRRRAYEEYYSLFQVSSLSKSRWGNQTKVKLHQSPTIINISDSSDEEDSAEFKNAVSSAETSIDNEINYILLKKEEKRKHLFQELCETEKNYIKALELLKTIKLEATNNAQPEGAILNQTEAKMIFGSLDEIIIIHKQIYKLLQTNLENLDSAYKAFTTYKKEIMKYYVTFATDWTESDKTYKRCKRENHRFYRLLETVANGDARDLFIRPIQRLPSICLLLKEINKNTRADSPDSKYLVEAIKTISDVLEMMNEDRARIEKQELMFVIHKLIENCPPDLIASRREYIEQFYAREITSKENALGVHLIIFLFSDVLEVAKVRSKCKYQGFFKLDHEMENSLEKPLKHVAMIPLAAITHVLQFKEDSGCSRKLFGFNIRNENQGKTVNCFQYLDSKLSFEDMLCLMAKHLKRNQTSTSVKEEELILRSLPSRRISVDPIYHTKSTNKHTKDVKNLAAKAFNSMLKKTDSKRRRPRSASCSELKGSSFKL